MAKPSRPGSGSICSVALLVAWMAFGANPVFGQDRESDFESPLNQPLVGSDLKLGRARQATAKFAACEIRNYPDKMRTVLASPLEDKKAQSQLQHMLLSNCAGRAGVSMLAFPPLALRGALYEALYVHDFGVAVPQFSAHVEMAETKTDAAASKTEAAARQYAFLVRIGECVDREAPGEARSLVMSEIESAGEGAAIQKIAVRVPHCTDQSIRFSRSMLRGVIAESLYRISVAGRPSAGAVPAGSGTTNGGNS